MTESYIFHLSSHVIVKHGNITEEITGNDKKICPMGVVCKVLNRKILSAETFCFPDKRLLSIFNFSHQVTYCFFTCCYLAHNKFSLNVLLFSCNTFGQLCLGGPSYSSRTVIPEDIVNLTYLLFSLEIFNLSYSLRV